MSDETSRTSPRDRGRRLLSPARVRQLFAKHHPRYGAELAPEDWERITERLEALARLLWRISQRLTAAEPAATDREPSAPEAGDP